MPLMRPILNIAPAISAPVEPAETNACASLRRTISMPTTKVEFFLRRSAITGMLFGGDDLRRIDNRQAVAHLRHGSALLYAEIVSSISVSGPTRMISISGYSRSASIAPSTLTLGGKIAAHRVYDNFHMQNSLLSRKAYMPMPAQWRD